jgi:DNA-binding transcriptional LysR family regulator
MLQIVQLRALREVLDAGSFAAAGERLGLTASAVSQQISSLERALGLALFERLPRAIRPTAAAATLAIRVDSVLTQLDILEREAQAIAAGTRGVVRIGAFPTASARLLPGALARLAGRRAGIDVLLDEGEPDELLHRVQSGSLDLTLVYCYDALPTAWPPGVAALPLLHESLILLSPARGPELRPDLADAGEMSWVASRERTAGARCLEILCNRAGFSPRITYRSNDYDVVRGLVAAGLGVAVIPALACANEPATRAMPLTLANAGRTVFLVRRDNDTNPLHDAVIRTFRQASRSLSSGILKAA